MVNGIERANRILLPSLLVLLVIGVIRSLTLPNATAGLNYLFDFHGASLSDPAMWLEARFRNPPGQRAQVGIALILFICAIATMLRSNAFITGFAIIRHRCWLLWQSSGNFSLSGSPDAAIESLKAGNQGLTFIVIPQLFEQLPGAQLLTAFFFSGAVFAAISSLIAMFEFSTWMFMDFGMSRKSAAAGQCAHRQLLRFAIRFFAGCLQSGLGLGTRLDHQRRIFSLCCAKIRRYKSAKNIYHCP